MSEPDNAKDPVLEWWRENIADRDSGHARALSARLRRADAAGVLTEPQVHRLAKRLRIGPARAGELVRLVQVLAHVRSDHSQSLAQRLGGSEPTMSQLRFQRLLRTDTAGLAEALRRALAMVDRTCNVRDLSWVVRLWEQPEQGDAVRARWAFDYFDSPRPVDIDTENTTNNPETEA